ncbi:MAG TPA: response regulator transcription factor [Caulobacteraceae bacterium]|nr:response regulator transcription factor [Caulobacteraceae bacterium]
MTERDDGDAGAAGALDISSADAPLIRVLIVDDDGGLQDETAGYLKANGYAVETARDAPTMDSALGRLRYDLIILDVMMPGENGLSICRRLSEADAPAIIIMSAMGDQVDRIIGLELGADDYLAKPASPRELLARIRAVIRRRGRVGGSRTGGARLYQFAGFTLDQHRRRLTSPRGLTILLTRAEMALLVALLDARGGVLTRDQLLEGASLEPSDSFDRAVDVQISRLRRKLGDSDRQGVIRTVRGAGYRVASPVILC